jgi:hypothetical protein
MLAAVLACCGKTAFPSRPGVASLPPTWLAGVTPCAAAGERRILGERSQSHVSFTLSR